MLESPHLRSHFSNILADLDGKLSVVCYLFTVSSGSDLLFSQLCMTQTPVNFAPHIFPSCVFSQPWYTFIDYQVCHDVVDMLRMGNVLRRAWDEKSMDSISGISYYLDNC